MAGTEQDAAPSAAGGWLRRLGLPLGLLLFVVTALVLRDRWEQVDVSGGLPGPVPAVIATTLYVLGNALLARNWRDLVALAGPRLRWVVAARVWSVSQLARYVVSLGHVAGRGIAARRQGVTGTTAMTAALLELVMFVTMMSTLALATSPWWFGAVEGARWLAAIAVIPVGLLAATLAAPTRVLRIVAWASRRAPLRWIVGRRADTIEVLPITRFRTARIVGGYVANSSVRVLAFLVLLAAVGGEVGDLGVRAVGAYALGQLAGALAVFAPGGLGARESALALLLGPALGGGAAVVLAASMRLLEVLAELLFLGLVRLLPTGPTDRAGGDQAGIGDVATDQAAAGSDPQTGRPT